MTSSFTATSARYFYDGVYNTVEGASPPPSGSLTVSGSGFGSGPNVVLFKRFDGVAGEDVELAGEIGSFTDNDVNTAPEYYTEGGRTYGVSGPFGSAFGLRKLRINTSAFTEYRIAYKYGVPAGYRWPTGTLSGGANTGSSHTKTAWVCNHDGPDNGIAGGDGYADIIAPTFTGSEGECAGNSIILASGKRLFLNSTQCSQLTPGNVVQLSWHQKPVSGDLYNVNGHTHRLGICSAFTANANSVVTCSPYGSTDVGVEDYKTVLFPGWLGNDTSAEVREIFADFYLATGANSGKCIILHDAATIADSDEAYIVPPSSWSDTSISSIALVAREQLAYYTILSDTATVLATGAATYS